MTDVRIIHALLHVLYRYQALLYCTKFGFQVPEYHFSCHFRAICKLFIKMVAKCAHTKHTFICNTSQKHNINVWNVGVTVSQYSYLVHLSVKNLSERGL